MIALLISLYSIFNGVSGIINTYGLLAIFVLMVLESASLPIPSEVVIPLAGLLAAKGIFSPYLAFAVILVAGIILSEWELGLWLFRICCNCLLPTIRLQDQKLQVQ